MALLHATQQIPHKNTLVIHYPSNMNFDNWMEFQYAHDLSFYSLSMHTIKYISKHIKTKQLNNNDGKTFDWSSFKNLSPAYLHVQHLAQVIHRLDWNLQWNSCVCVCVARQRIIYVWQTIDSQSVKRMHTPPSSMMTRFEWIVLWWFICWDIYIYKNISDCCKDSNTNW